MLGEILRTFMIMVVLLVAGNLADNGNDAYVWFIVLAIIMTLFELKGKNS